MTEDNPAGVNDRLAANIRELNECHAKLDEARRQLAEVTADAHHYSDVRAIDRIDIRPQDGYPDFLIAYASGTRTDGRGVSVSPPVSWLTAVRRPGRASRTHQPDDWCACEPHATDRCEYRILADTVDASLNTRDGDAAEVALHCDAVERIARYVTSLPCTCPYGSPYDIEPCGRCDALNQVQGKPAQR